MSTLTNVHKKVQWENYLEKVSQNNHSDGQKLSTIQTIGSKGIDDLYKVNEPDVDYVIVEYKFIQQLKG